MDVLEEQEAPLQDTQLEDIDFGVSVSGSGPQTAGTEGEFATSSRCTEGQGSKQSDLKHWLV